MSSIRQPLPPRKQARDTSAVDARARKLGLAPAVNVNGPPTTTTIYDHKENISPPSVAPQKPSTSPPPGGSTASSGLRRLSSRGKSPSGRSELPQRSKEHRPSTASARSVVPYVAESMCSVCLEVVHESQLSRHLESCGRCPPALRIGGFQPISVSAVDRSRDREHQVEIKRNRRIPPGPSVRPIKLLRCEKDWMLPADDTEETPNETLYVSCAVCLELAPVTVQQRSLLSCKLFGPRRIHFLTECDHGVCTSCLATQLDAWHGGQDAAAPHKDVMTIQAGVEGGNSGSHRPSSEPLGPRSAPYKLPRKESVAMCPVDGCQAHLSLLDFRQLFPAAIVDVSLERRFKEFIDHQLQNPRSGYTRCPNCHTVAQRVVELDDDTPTTPERTFEIVPVASSKATAEMHYERFRLRCAHCSHSFCGACLETPYHLGCTCEEHQLNSQTKQCRFCDRRASPPQPRGFFASLFSKPRAADCCDQEACLRRAEGVCHKVLECGHGCCGRAGEDGCLPCLQECCPGNTTSQAATEYCAICYVDELKSQACIQLSCGHVFHDECVRDKLARRWPGPRITFSYLNCPICSEPIRHPALAGLLHEHFRFRELVQSKMLMRLEHEGMLGVEAITNESSEFYQAPEKYAEATLCYYPCVKCGKPYFGGFKQCEAAAMDDDEEGPFNKNELVCPACVPNADLRVCRLHGTDFIEYKCKFCCSIAQWYCWGNTHFCTSCHRRQEMGDYLTKKRKEDLPKCEGRRKCPLGCDHPPNGVEFALGCALCRRNQTDQF